MTIRRIDILRVAYLDGPNIWTYRPVLEAWVDIHDLEDAPSNTLPGFNERLAGFLPGLIEHRCSVGERGGFLQRLRDGTWPAHILEHVMIELQTLAGMQTGFGRAREAGPRGIYKVAVRSRHEQVSRCALTAARDMVMAAIDDTPFDVAACVAELRAILEDVALGPSTACIVDAAAERGIPFLRLNEGNLVQLGYGARQRRVWTAETDRTSAIAEGISRDKELTKRLLQSCGVPVPEGRVVESPEDAWDAAEDIGLPVVVKPSDANHGRGVATNLMRREDVEAAFPLAAAEGSEVIVERFIEGDEHRLLVVNGELVAAARGETVSITGDGRSTVAELVERDVNTDPRRGNEEEFPLEFIRIEDDAVRFELARQGVAANTVPQAGQVISIQRHGNVDCDVTDLVHPDTAAAAALAAKVVGLDIAGIDLVARDIARPLAEQGGAIVEVNAGPGLLMHLKPAQGEGRPVGQAIARHLFAEHDSGRIPIVGVTGSRHATFAARLVSHALNLQGTPSGLACADGLYLRRRRIQQGNCANRDAARRLLINRTIETAVIENPLLRMLDEGLPYDRCHIGVVTDLDADAAFPEFHIHDDEQLHKVVRTQVDVVLRTGVAVLDADDLRIAALAPLCDGEVVFFSSASGDTPGLAEHLSANGRAVLQRDGQIVLATGKATRVLLPLSAFAGADRNSRFPIKGVLAAIGVAVALGLPVDIMRAAVETFFDSMSDVPIH